MKRSVNNIILKLLLPAAVAAFLLISCGKYKAEPGSSTNSGSGIPVDTLNGVGITIAGGNGDSTAANQLNSPFGVFVDSAGNIFIADTYNDRVQKWTPGSTSGITIVGGNGTGNAANQLNLPTGLFLDAAGDIYIADQGNNRVQKWIKSSNTVITVANSSDSTGQDSSKLSGPTGLFVDSAGNIYIADQYNNRIQKWPADTSVHYGVTVAGGASSTDLAYPVAVYVDHAGNIFVSDNGNNRIQKYSADTSIHTPLTVAGGNGVGYGSNQLSGPWGISVNNNGDLYVCDRYNDRIQKYVNGIDTAVTVAGGNGRGAGNLQLFAAASIFVDKNGVIYIADTQNDRIQKWGSH
jgi:sugar lactone lactonase YvrE